ncbi:MAG: hypothetical protein OEU26_27700 [Candidatus Tectomicrobia bacterium]|nr:hypothetical protein [Candidatus Tectomicrobia bacterium]
MSLFTSDRERHLWFWTLAVVVAIYSTLGRAATLAGAFRDRGLIDAVFGFGFFLVLATIMTQGLKTRPGGAEIGVALGVAAAYLMVFVRMAIPAAERTHLIEYGVMAVFIHEALTERARVTASPYPPCSPSWRRRCSACSTNASKRFCPTACLTPATSCSTCSRA